MRGEKLEGIDTKMKRIAILSVYDSEGVVHRCLEYYIKSLCEVISDLIIVVIDHMNDESLMKLRKYSDEIYIKENKGYDAAAYKLVLENYLDMERLYQYDELILTNDTCFGPFIPFEDIFEEMDKKLTDFWGLKYIENNYLNHLQSNFLVFSRNTFKDLCQYFKTKICAVDDKESVVTKFEMCLFSFLINRGFRLGYFGELLNYDTYRAPDYCIIEEHYPLMKKRCFEKKSYKHENCSRALRYIRDHTNYDVTMILDYARQKYNVSNELMKYKAPFPYFIWKSICSQADIQGFCKSNEEIYIYGTGQVASRIYGYYQEYLGDMKGFVVSNDQVVPANHFGKKVFRISEIKNKMAGIIVGASKAVTEEVRPNLIEYKNLLYLWKNV